MQRIGGTRLGVVSRTDSHVEDELGHCATGRGRRLGVWREDPTLDVSWAVWPLDRLGVLNFGDVTYRICIATDML